MAAVSAAYAKPLVVMSFLGTRSRSIQSLIDSGVPVYPSAVRSARAMRSLLDYLLLKEGISTTPSAMDVQDPAS